MCVLRFSDCIFGGGASEEGTGQSKDLLSLINGHSKFIPKTGCRWPKFHIELPGNPILGDGKLDNQDM